MAFTLIRETDVIRVSNPPILLYGQPGSGKTSLAQTAENPLTLDFDMGIHRSAFRKSAIRVETWEDILQVERDGVFDDYSTIAVDVVDQMLKSMANSIIAQDAKCGMRSGGLSITGWGVLKTTFDTWVSRIRTKKQLIMIAHQKEEKDGDNRVMRPDIAGGSYGICMQNADIVGYVSYRNNRRHVAFDPTDSYFAKNGAGLDSTTVPDFSKSPKFMAELIEKAKANLGHTAAASAATAKMLDEWRTRLDPERVNIDTLNGEIVEELKKIKSNDPLKPQVWALILEFAGENGCVFDSASKSFVQKGEAA